MMNGTVPTTVSNSEMAGMCYVTKGSDISVSPHRQSIAAVESCRLIGALMLLPLLAALWLWPASPAQAEIQDADVTGFAALPLFVDFSGGGSGGRASFMFAVSRDEQLFFKAYSDYSDLDGNGFPDVGYTHSFEYYGLFDPQKCYSYDDANQRFVPEGFSSQDSLGAYNYECNALGRFWAGNFLNWATTVRLEIVQKVLYGGRRIVDASGGDTVLEGAYTTPDNHSFAKYIDDSDLIEQVTPVRWADIGAPADDQVLTICRTSLADVSGSTEQTHQLSLPPMFKIVYGDYRVWDLQNSSQCVGGRSSFSSTSSRAPDFTPSSESPRPFRFIGGDGSRNGANDNWSWSDYSEMYLAHRVQVCVPAYINADNKENCKQYPDGNFKPIGILQRYGEINAADFGLMTTNYVLPHAGGQLRRRMGSFSNEVNTADGTFITYTFANIPDEGLFIQLLNNLYMGPAEVEINPENSRRFDLDEHSNPPVRVSTKWITILGQTDASCSSFFEPRINPACAAWGNPFAEMLQETVRYLAGQSRQSQFTLYGNPGSAAAFSKLTDGLQIFTHEVTWDENSDLIGDGGACAPINVLGFNASLISMDGDQMATAGPASRNDIETYTNSIGTLEGISGNLILADSDGSDSGFDDTVCSLQAFTNLSSVRGLCPDAADFRGSYLSAGLAYYAHTQDLNSNIADDQVLNHLFVDLRPNIPQIVIPLDAMGAAFVGKSVIIQAAYINTETEPGTTGWGSGNLTKFYPVRAPVIRRSSDDTRDIYEGTYLAAWEDAASGADFDEDVWGYIDFTFEPGNPSGRIFRVGTQVIGDNALGGQHLFGFTILGTTQDGFHAYSGHVGVLLANNPGISRIVYNDPVNVSGAVNPVPSCGTTQTQFRPGNPSLTQTVNLTGGCTAGSRRVHLFTPSSDEVSVLQSPLFYAAKYGGFQDSNNNAMPDLQEEWDALDLDGNSTPDGIPDNYFPVSDPSRLSPSLERAFVQGGVSQNSASGTAAALVANEREGLGAVFQALFEPTREDAAGNEVTWIGTLQALFIDAEGLLREDSNENSALDGYDMDRVVDLFYDESLGETQALVYSSSDADTFMSSGSEVLALADLKVLWNAREQLSVVDANNIYRQRNYGSEADVGRYIFTWKDIDKDGRVSGNEEVAFIESQFQGGDANFLDVQEAEVPNLVEYLRGGSPTGPGWRNRVMDYDGDGTTETLRLGDIINSSPAAITLPSESYDLLTGNSAYATFRAQYRNRRQMVYVGANDGMLHAFNSGFYNTDDQEVTLEPSSGSAVPHPLGSEVWAYVPRSLQPYLKWLADPDYPHVFYVDAPPRIFDAQVFQNDATHPGGWGTVLVVGFRLGGGAPTNRITVDADNDGLFAANADNDDSDDVDMLASYVVMDITDPEQPPVLLAELSPAGLGFSFSRPAVVPMGGAWYLVFGSGPTSRSEGTSSNAAQLYVYNLNTLVARLITPTPTTFSPASANLAFVGGITVADYDLNLMADALYFGTASGTGTSGALYRMRINEQTSVSSWSTPAVLLNANRPFLVAPTLSVDEDGDPWVYSGTGRLLAPTDNMNSQQQTLYGFVDPPRTADTQVNVSDLVDVSNARSFTNGQVDLDNDGTLDQTFTRLRTDVKTAGGWRRDYRTSGANPSERSLNVSTLIGEVLFNTAYTPPGGETTINSDGCGGARLGTSVLLGLDFLSGVPHTFGVFGRANCTLSVCTQDGVEEALGETSLGRGLSSLPSLHLGQPGEDAPGQVTVVVQQSTGEVQTVEAQAFSAAESVELDWGELLEL